MYKAIFMPIPFCVGRVLRADVSLENEHSQLNYHHHSMLQLQFKNFTR